MNPLIKNKNLSPHFTGYWGEYLHSMHPVGAIFRPSHKALNRIIKIKDNSEFLININNSFNIVEIPNYRYARISSNGKYISLLHGLFSGFPMNRVYRAYSFCTTNNAIFNLVRKDLDIKRSGLLLENPFPRNETKSAPISCDNDYDSKLLFQLAFRKTTKFYKEAVKKHKVLDLNVIIDSVYNKDVDFKKFSPVLFVDFSIFSYPELYNIYETDKKIFNIDFFYKKLKDLCEEEGIEIIIVDNLFDMFYENISDNTKVFVEFFEDVIKLLQHAEPDDIDLGEKSENTSIEVETNF